MGNTQYPEHKHMSGYITSFLRTLHQFARSFYNVHQRFSCRIYVIIIFRKPSYHSLLSTIVPSEKRKTNLKASESTIQPFLERVICQQFQSNCRHRWQLRLNHLNLQQKCKNPQKTKVSTIRLLHNEDQLKKSNPLNRLIHHPVTIKQTP